MLYKKVETNLNFLEREKEVLDFWKENDVFQKSIDQRDSSNMFTFYDGPPTANGTPHVGHVLTRVIKDVFPRYKSMKGAKVYRKAGWDTHGLPVEIEVEKMLGLDGKEQIEEYGIEEFIEKCKESVWKYKGMWEDFSARVGYWVDMDEPYVTYENNYIESVWWSLKEIWKKDLLYKGYKIIPYCARCGTPLSSHEVAQGYKDIKEESVYVKFTVKGKKDEFILAWTTTPWTLPSNVGLTVHPNETYVKAEINGEKYILAEALYKNVLGDEAKVLETFKGKDIEYLEYEPIYEFARFTEKAYFVVCGEHVTLTDGTGIVHTAPAFGEDDFAMGVKYNLPVVNLVKLDGTFTEDVREDWTNKFVKEVDKDITKDLKERGLLFKAEMYEHSYPHCWRCKTPLLYYARESWFIKMTAVKEEILKNNDLINWIPKTIGEKRFGSWLENLIDWAISRDRYWGTPLPVWECECGEIHTVGSIEELREMSVEELGEVELHKPYIDNVHLKCPKCGKGMTRVSAVIDCWYDSGSMPFAQWHYPFENKEMFEKNFPANYISEAVDQTRGWFYSLLAISTLLFDKPAYENVIVLGHILDAKGEKMSKSKGNSVEPFDALNKFGADAIRWYFYINSAPWLPSKFFDDAILEYQRKFIGTLWNTYAFYVLYANIDDFNPTDYSLEFEKLSVMDKWVISRLNSLIKEVSNLMDEYKITEAAKTLDKFTDDLSNWYIRRCRERYWESGMEQDKINAYMTLYTVLTSFAKVIAPFVPFMAESMYQNLVTSVDKNAKISVHLCDYPEVVEEYIDEELEANMENVLKIVSLGRAARNGANIKNRQPLSKVFIEMQGDLPDSYKEIVKEELNVKELELKKDLSSYITYRFKPQLKTVGPKYGKLLGKIKEHLDSLDGNAAYSELEKNNVLKFEALGEEVSLSEEDLLIDVMQKEGYASSSEGGITVVIDTALTEELLEEGYVREIISKTQTMRKEAGFEVQDHIKLYYDATEKLNKVIEKFMPTIKDEVLADNVLAGTLKENTKEWDINGEKAVLSVEKI